MYKKIKNSRGFTLIELIVVVGIIGILVGIASPRFTGYTEKARIAKHSSNAKALENSIEIFNIENGRFPRRTSVAYSANEVSKFSENIRDLTGEEVALDSDGKYYDIDYLAIRDSISIPEAERDNYILQNPKGRVFYLESLTTDGESRNTVYSKDEVDDMINNEGYIEVSSAEDLNNVRNDLNGKYIQTADINLDNINKFVPIGNDIEKFSGEFNGGGFVINNLSINSSEENYIGLFGYANKATLKNIYLNNVSLNGNRFVGGLTGRQSDTLVDNVHTDGDIKGESETGGLSGWQHMSTVTRSTSSGTVKGEGSQIGGLIGHSQHISKISNCSTNATVSSNSDKNGIGGLIGRHFGSPYEKKSSVINSFATGPVSGIKGVGGLIGLSVNAEVANSFATGSVSGQADVGGLIGKQGMDGWRYDESKTLNSYSSGSVNGIKNVGKLIGNHKHGLVSNSGWVIDNKIEGIGFAGSNASVSSSKGSEKSTIDKIIKEKINGLN